MKTQIGELVTADLLEGTLTFEVGEDIIAQTGKYAIVPIEDYEKLVNCTDNATKAALNLPVLIGRFCAEQPVSWENIKYWVVEDNGGDKVLVANSKTSQHPEYNDWWVNRDELNSL